MPFGSEVFIEPVYGIPIIGNYDTGYIIGLDERGLGMCQKIASGTMEIEELTSVDPVLATHLNLGGFFSNATHSSPTSAYFHITQKCNLHCTGCYSYTSERNRISDLTLSQIKIILSRLAEAGISTLVLSGGEPFLRKDLPSICQAAKQNYNFERITIASNGTLISDEAAKNIADYVDQISISFDGSSDLDRPYIRKAQRLKLLKSATEMLQRHGIDTQLTLTVHAKNVEVIPDFIRFAKTLNSTASFSLFSAPSCNAETRSLALDKPALLRLSCHLLEEKRARNAIEYVDESPMGITLAARRSCGAGVKTLSVSSQGDLFPCHMLQHPQYSLGSVLDHSIAELLQHRPKHTTIPTVDEIEDCMSCDIKHICGGGCRARSLFRFGTLDRADPYCELTQTVFRDTLAKFKQDGKEED